MLPRWWPRLLLSCKLRFELSKLPSPSKGVWTSAITKVMQKLNPEVGSCTVLTPKIAIALPSAALSCRSWLQGLSWISAAKSQGATESSAPVSSKIFQLCNEDLWEARGCCSKFPLHSCCWFSSFKLFVFMFLWPKVPKLFVSKPLVPPKLFVPKVICPIVCFFASCGRSCLSWPSCSLAWSSCFCFFLFVVLSACRCQTASCIGVFLFCPFCSWGFVFASSFFSKLCVFQAAPVDAIN